MEEEEDIFPENNIHRDPDYSVPDTLIPPISASACDSSQSLNTTLSNQSVSFETRHSDTARTSLLSSAVSERRNIFRNGSQISSSSSEKRDPVTHNTETFGSHDTKNRQEEHLSSFKTLSLPKDSINKGGTASISYQQLQTGKCENKKCDLPHDTGQESVGEVISGTQYLLPETSGFVRSSRSAIPELKRGRGRPRKKEGLVPFSLRTNSHGFGQVRGHPFGTRGFKGSVTRGLTRGSRGGRRGRPPFHHAVQTVRSSTRLSCEEFSNPRLSPADFAPSTCITKSSSWPVLGMAELLKQPSVGSSGSDIAVKGCASIAASPLSGAQSGSSSDPSMTPESQNSGHLCALCNCGERSLLGQGETWRFEPSDGFDVFKLPEPKTLREAEEVDTVGKSKGPPPTTWRRSRGPLKTGRERSRSPRQSGEKDSTGCHVSDELSLVGFHDDTEISQIFESSGHVWVHHCCALWSEGVTIGETNHLELVDKAVYNAMSHRCAHCRKFGATVVCCIPDCEKRFHFPCASAGGCFQDMKTLSLLCSDHIDQAEAVAGNAACCIQCELVDNVKDQLFCTSCGHHYHGACLCPPVDLKPIVRAGWQCPNCKICQTCRTAGEDSKMLVCDKCDKGYHTFCLKPVMTTIPKNGWKCKNCRVCTDCGSRTPGSGPSSRWHLNYSVCDSCYQQRNKGLCCPLCGKAYRHFHNKTMLPCMLCKKYVHIECDPSINPKKLDKLKDLPQDYICTVCRETDPDAVMELDQQLPALSYAMSEESVESFMTDDLVSKDDPMLTEALLSGPSGVGGGISGGGLTASSSQDSLFMGDDSSSSLDFETSDRSLMSPGSRRDSFEFSRKSRLKSKQSSSERHHHHHHSNQPQQQPVAQLQTLSEKRQGPKIKVKIGGQVMGLASGEGSSPISHHSLSQTPFSASSPAYSMQSVDGQMEEKEKEKDKKDDDDDDDGDDHPSTLILAESLDNFVMDQDICKACGSFGKDEESRMIVCTQCGQCYHPYCVSVTVTAVMLQKGWRCLDCTVCEGCGGPYDEGRLLLCDDCDISYHTYCLDPPLETVPKGNWKCKWCVMCVNCGSTSPGFACQWMSNYTQCGPCHSKLYCPVCMDSYLIDQLIIQCQQCDRWLHCECDGLTCEDEAEIAADFGYHCFFCRPRTGKDGPLPPPPPPPSPPKEERVTTPPPIVPYIAPTPEPPRHFFVDGVYLYQTGLNQIQRLQVTNPKKFKQQHQQLQRRMSQLEEPEESSSGALAGDEGGPDEVGEDGVKKRKPRRVFGLGVGGFIVRQRSRQWLAKRQASYEEQEDGEKGAEQPGGDKSDKPKRRRKMKKSKLEVAFPFYMQEAFFGKSILDQQKETTKGLLKIESDSDRDEASPPPKMVPAADLGSIKSLGGSSELDGSMVVPGSAASALPRPHTSMSGSEQSEDIHSIDESELKDIFHEFQENDDIFSIIHEELKDDGLSLDGMEAMTSKDSGPSKSSELPDNLENMLASDMDKELDVEHMISEGLVHFDSKTVEDIFSGVLSDSHPNQTGDASSPSGQFNLSMPPGLPGTSQSQSNTPSHPGISPTQGAVMRGPMGSQPITGMSSLPPFGMPYSSTYGHTPQMGQNFPQGMSPGLQGPSGASSGPLPPWGMMDDDTGDSNKRTILKWEQEEEMGDQATISCVLYVNMCHPDLKQKYPDWSERSKQIAKLWRKLTPDEKAPYLSKARKNRTSSRVQKAQKKKAEQKSKNQVSQELQRRQEIQKQQDSEAMPPPPAPPPLPPGELFHDGSAPVMVPHAGPSSYSRHGWPDDGPTHKPPSTPTTPDHQGPPGDQVFLQQGLTPGGSMATPDPYMFDPFSPTQTRPTVRPPHRLPGLQAFGASSPRDDDVLFASAGMSPRVHTSSDMFGHGPPTPNQDMFGHGPPTPSQEMFMGGPRRPQGPGPHMSIPGQADASNPLGDPGKPRVSGDPYAFAPSTPQASVPDDPFLPLGPPTPDPYHQGRRGDMFPGGPPQMRPPLTPNSMGPGSPYPGSPVRMSDPNFRHPLSRSNSLTDPYSMQIGTPRPQMDPSMARSISDVGPEASQMYRDGRMPVQLAEDGGDNQGNMHHQQLRVILGQQTKQRMAKKQEEAERMMQGPSPSWQGPNGSDTIDSYQPRPPFPPPSPQGFMRSPHPGMGPQATRPPFFPGSGAMQRLSHPEGFMGPSQEGIMPEQRSQFMQMIQERMESSSSVTVTPSGPILTSQQMGGNLPPFMSQGGESSMLRQPPQQQTQQVGHSRAGEAQPGLPRPMSRTHHGGDDEIFTENEALQPSTSKVSGSEDNAAVESDTLLEGIGKTTKPSLSSEEDKNEDDDLLSADGTFDILKYADPDLDLDLDDKMFEHLDFMEDHGNGQGDQKKSDEEKSDDSKDVVKDEKGSKGSSSRPTDFQAQFLEFNQRQKSEALKVKDETDKTTDDKEKEKSVVQIAAMLQGTEPMSVRLSGNEPGTPDIKPIVTDQGVPGGGIPRTTFNPNLASPHMSPSHVPNQPGSSGLPSPKIIHSPRSGQPSPRTPGIQSPFNTLIGGRHSASPHSQPMTPGGPQLSPFSAGSVQIPFSPPTSSGGQQTYGQGPNSAPHSPYPTSSQPPFASMPSPGPQHMMSPSYPAASMGLRPLQGFSQMGHPGNLRGPLYGQPPHGIRPGDGQPGRFPRPGEAGMEGLEGLGPMMPQSMTLPDGRPHPIYQQMQVRGMRGPPPSVAGHPSLQNQLSHQQARHPFPGHPPRLSHPPQIRGVGPRQPGPPFTGPPPSAGPQSQMAQREQITLLDDLVEKEKEEQKRQAEQQAMMHRRDGTGPSGEQGLSVMSSGPPSVSGAPPPPISVGGMPMRLEHPGMQMPCQPDGGGGGWTSVSEPVVGGPQPGQFQQGFPPRMMHSGMPQRPPVPFPGPPDIRGPGPSAVGSPQLQAMPMGPPTPVSPPSGEMGPEYERQANQYEDWLAKQAMYLESQVKLFEGQVNKLKRSKKTIQARQRLAKKNGQELNPTDTAELERISTEQSGLQKQLEAQRKLLRQHQHQMQDYKTKQQMLKERPPLQRSGREAEMKTFWMEPELRSNFTDKEVEMDAMFTEEQFGRMWTGGIAEAPLPGATMPMSHPRTPGGHNSVRLSPTARQEYDAYMQNRIRQANQMQQQNRMRAPTTILGDNNPFSEAFQQREQIQRAPPTPGATLVHSPGTPGSGPSTPMLPPGTGPLPTRPPFGLGGPEPISNPTSSSIASNPTPTTGSSPVTISSNAPPIITSSAGPHMAPGPQPMPVGPPLTPGPSGQPLAAVTQGQMLPVHSGTPAVVPRGPMEGMGAVHFFRERNMPFDAGAGSRFPRPLGQGTFPSSPAPGQGPNPRLPPYPGSPGIYPQAPGPGSSVEPGRMPFQPGMNFQSGMPLASPQLLDGPPSTQPPAAKEKKKRKKKKKCDEQEDAHSQPLPPSMPNQTVLGPMSSQSSSTMTSSSTAGTTPKPAELPRPQSETERRILEILNNSQKELQNPSSPSSARGGKSPRSRSPARAQPIINSSEVDKGQGGVSVSTSSSTGPAISSSSSSLSSDSHIISQAGSVAGMPDNPNVTLSSCAFVGDKLRQGEGKNIQAGNYSAAVSSVSETQISAGIPSSVAPPPPHMQQRMPLHPQQPGGSIPPGFQSQQHMHQLQTLARMQQFQQQQFTGMSEGARHRLDSQQMPVGGPRYSQMQRFPLGVGQPPHSFHGRPQMRPGNSPYLTQGMATRMLQDPRLPGADTHMIPSHSIMQQRMSIPTSAAPHLRPPISLQHNLHSNQTLAPSSPLPQQTTQASSLSHIPPESPLHYYQSLPSGISPQSPSSTAALSIASSSHLASTAIISSVSDSLPPSSTGSQSVSSIQTSQLASSLQQPPPSSSSSSSSNHGSSTPVSSSAPQLFQVPSASSNIPAEVKCQSPTTTAQGSMTASSSSMSTSTPTTFITTPVSIPDTIAGPTASSADSEGKDEKTSTVCEDGIHCGTDDEDEVRNNSKKVCDDGIHCGTDDEDEVISAKSSKKVCDDGIHCGTDDEDEVNVAGSSKKVCDDGIHCGTDDEDEVNVAGSSKKVCDDGIHCGTDDEDEVMSAKSSKKVCDDGIHCGTDDEDEVNGAGSSKKVCDDGIHCGTDDEDEVNVAGSSKKVCDDGIHCGTDDEDEVNGVGSSKKVCDDGIHCGTDDEDEVRDNSKKVCNDGIHCGTDDEDEVRDNSKKVCDDGIHCGTDDEDEVNGAGSSKKVCDDGIHCGTDDEDEVRDNSKKVCNDGIHCGTDDEDEVRDNSKKVCDDGIHCGRDDEDEVNGAGSSKKVCDDGIHCGTDDEDEVRNNSKKVCDDGIHCGTDDEDEVNGAESSKKVCDDGIHCGTDDEDEVNGAGSSKKVCDDGIHCGTDDEDEVNGAGSSKKVCDDGIHCGTDDEDEVNGAGSSKKVCDDGIHCGTDDEDEVNGAGSSKKVCVDGIHCGTDDEDEVISAKSSKKVCDDGIHCGTDDEDEVNGAKSSKKVCDDGIHCGTDDEDDDKKLVNKPCVNHENNQNVSSTDTSQQPPTLLSQSDVTSTSSSIVTPLSSSASSLELVDVAPAASAIVCSNTENSPTSSSTSDSPRLDRSMHSTESTTKQMSSTPLSVTLTCNSDSIVSQNSRIYVSKNHVSNSNSQSQLLGETCFETELHTARTDLLSSGGTKATTCSEMTVTETSTNVPMVSIDFEVSSQLAAVSRSLANYKPRLGSDTSEPSADTVRPSDTLTAFSFPGASALPSTGALATPTQAKSEAANAPLEETSLFETVTGSGKVSLSPPSIDGKENAGHFEDATKPANTSIKSKSPDNANTSVQPQTQERNVPASSGHVVEGFSSSGTRDFNQSVPQPTELFPRTLTPSSFPTSSSSFSLSCTPAQDTVSAASHNLSTSTVPLSTVTLVTTSLSTISSLSTPSFSPLPAPASVSLSAQVQPAIILPSLSHLSSATQVSRPWIVPPSQITQGGATTTSSADGPVMASSVSSSRSFDSRPVIPPLRIRMDGQSQAQVYESSMSSTRDYQRFEFSSAHMRNKVEGDLKLVLRKSSDGTAELISGPSFREKIKRSSAIADTDSPSSFSRSESDQRRNSSSSSSSSHAASISSSASLASFCISSNMENVFSQTTSVAQSPQNLKPSEPSISSSTSTSSNTFSTVSSVPLGSATTSPLVVATTAPPVTSVTATIATTTTPSLVAAATAPLAVTVTSPLVITAPQVTATAAPLMQPLPPMSLPAYSSSSSPPVTSVPAHPPSASSTPAVERTEPFTSKPGSGMFRNVTYTKSPDTDVVKINVGCTKSSGDGTKKVIRSYTTDIQALERLQSTIDAVASGESAFVPDLDNEPPSRPESQDSRSASTPMSNIDLTIAAVSTMVSSTAEAAISQGSIFYSNASSQMGMDHSPHQHHQQQQQQQLQHNQQMGRVLGQHQQQRVMQQQQQQQQPLQQLQQNRDCMQQSQTGFPQIQSFHQSRLTRPPLDLLAQVSQSALSSAGTAIPSLTHSTSQDQRMPYMMERPPSSSSEHSPLHTSPHQPYPGMMGPRSMGNTSGMTSKPGPGQNSQAYMSNSGPPQQQFMPGVRFPPRMHHDMSAAPPYGMPSHPMSPTGTGMHRQRPPHFGMVGDMSRMQRPPRGMTHPQHRQMPPEMMNPDHGMHPRMTHQFMSPSHPGMSDMSPNSHGLSHSMAPNSHGVPQSPHGMPQSPHGMPQSPHGMQTSPHGIQTSPHGMQTSPHGMQTSPHGIQTSPHGMQTSPHGMQRPPMMNPHHAIMQGGPPSSYPQASIGVSGGPLASLANFHPPGHPGINAPMGSPVTGPHHQRPPGFPQMMGGDNRMAAQLRMMVSSSDGPHMVPHYRHMMMRGMTPPGSQPSSQMSSPQMSPHMSPQMSPVMQTQPLRQLDNMPDDKSFITSLPPSSSMGLPGMPGDISMVMGGKQKQQRPYGSGMLQGDPCGFMHQQHHLQATSDSGSIVSKPGMTSPMSDTAISISSHVKLEPSEDSASADGSVSRDDLELDLKAHQNELLKHLLGTGHSSRQLPTPDSEDSLPSLTPEQQRQLELIDSMPLCKETEISTPEWESKTPEEKEKILEMRRQEYEQKRQEYEVSRKNKRKAVGHSNAPVEKKKRKTKVVAAAAAAAAEITPEIPKKRSKKAKLKENQLKELEAQAETFLQQLHNMPSIPLQEPVIATSMSILPIKGAVSLTGVSLLRGRFCSAYLDGVEDMYNSLLFPQPPPGLRPTVPSAETLTQRQVSTETKIKMVQGMDVEPTLTDPLSLLKNKDGGGLLGSRSGLRTSPRLVLPPQPRIEIKSEQMRDKKDERLTPDTVVSSSSPEFGFNEQELEYPGLRPIDPAVGNAVSPEDSISPVVPLVQPLPIKPAFSGIDQHIDLNVKQELGLIKQDNSSHDLGHLGPTAVAEPPARDLTVNLPNLTSGLAQPFLDPALDQQVSVTLTLSTGAAQDIGAVISAIADLLKIAVPPTYEITRTPSPEMFRMSLTHKEEAVNIHTLMSTRPRFCQHCDVFVLCSGIAKFKREFSILLDQDPDCGDEEMIFCSMNCSMQFSVALESRQRQAQLRIKELDASRLASQTPPPCPPIKLEAATTSAVQMPSSATVAANVDEIIAAVAADMSLSPAEPDTPGEMSASPGTPSTTPTSPLPTMSTAMRIAKRNRRSSSQVSDPTYIKPLVKKWRGLRWRRGNQELLDDLAKIPPIQAYELDKVWKSIGIIHRPKPSVEDKRKCALCQNAGDGDSDGPSRLLNMDVNKWVHLNCALWSYDVYETLNGALMNVELAFQRSLSSECTACRKMGATLACFKPRCINSYHLPCARIKGCMFYQDKTLLCPSHYPKVPIGTELTSLIVLRRVYINRDEDRQVASMIHQEEGHCSLRIGSLILHSIGQLLPHQMMCGKFHTKEHIYPVGFRTSRFYWSYYSLYKRCRYMCSIHDNDGEPEFRIQIIDSEHEELTFKDNSPAAVWMHILKPLETMRREADLVKMFPTIMAAEELFGLTEANVVKVLESLPGTDLLTNYNFKFGRSPLIEMPPAINPTGCARTEPKLRTHFRRPHTLQSTNSRSLPSTVTGVTGDMNSPYLKQFVHSKSQQYRRLKTDWKTLVYLGRSRIQGLGLYSARDLEKHTMVIEYIGDLIRNEVANRREKEYESQNRGVYMFRIDNEQVIDATKAGGPARYINHSCQPNCVAEVVDIEKESKIIIITSRKIVKGEELTYDYKFDFEDDQHKIPCMCGAANCRKWMN